MNMSAAAENTSHILGCPRTRCTQPVLCTTVCAEKRQPAAAIGAAATVSPAVCAVLEKITSDLAWHGPSGRQRGHIVVERAQMALLLAYIVRLQQQATLCPGCGSYTMTDNTGCCVDCGERKERKDAA